MPIESRLEVEKLLKEGILSQKKIAEQLHISEARVSQIKKSLISGTIPLNSPLNSPLNLRAKAPTTPLTKEVQAPAITQRLHKLVFSFKLLNPLGANEPVQIAMRHGERFTPIPMQGHTDALLHSFKLKARLYPTSLTIYAPEEELPLEASLSELLERAYDRIEEVAWDIEQRMGIKTKKLSKDTLLADIVQQHIALKDHPFAEWLREHVEKLIVPDPDGGEPLLVIDFSHDHDEVESENIAKAEAVIGSVKAFTKAVGLGQFDYNQVNSILLKLAERAAILTENQEAFASNLAEHAKLIKRLNWLLPATLLVMILLFALAVVLR